MTERCLRCARPIEWTVTMPGGKHMPVDADPPDDPDRGNLAVFRDGNGILRSRVLARNERPAAYERRAVTHFATCRNR